MLRLALEWWADKDPATVTAQLQRDYHAHRLAQVAGRTNRDHTGSRAVDLELSTLSLLCRWAVADSRLSANPFAQRTRFCDPHDITHCSTKQPATDEELHTLGAWLLAGTLPQQVSGARLFLGAMTGLRPGEHLALRWDASRLGPNDCEPGHRFRDFAGLERMGVTRKKNGQNPAVMIHPTLAEFLDAWREFHTRTWPGCPWLFPQMSGRAAADARDLTDHLRQACAALHLPERTGHGLRAYFVSVQRSQGRSDAEIGLMLGHASGERLVVATYGKAQTIHGTGLLDWLPADRLPAWSALRSIAAPVLTPQFAAA